MTDSELLAQCKTGMGIQGDSTALDAVLFQKLLAVKSFMAGAGVTDEALNDDMAAGVIVMGVTDLWNLKSGEIKFSPAFYTLVSQLVFRGKVLTVSSNPVNGAMNVAVDVKPILLFSARISSYIVSLAGYDAKNGIPAATELDITKQILTIMPSRNLEPATKYAVVIEGAAAYSGQTLDYTVLNFTTA